MPGSVTVEQRGNVLLATLHNPPHALMDQAMVTELGRLAERADTDPSVGGVVLTGGDPDAFVAHFDVRLILGGAKGSPRLSPTALNAALKTVGAARRMPGADAVLGRSPAAGLVAIDRMREVMLAIGRCSAVWIAALNGHTGGGGCELALACDQRWMADADAMIGQPEIFLGFPPGAGGTQRLVRLLGPAKALRICLDSPPMSPREAHEIGLVDRVLPRDELVDAAVAEASRLGTRIKSGIGAVKRAIYEGGSLPLADGLRLEMAEFLSAIAAPESIEAQEAYVRRTDELGRLPLLVPEEIDRAVERGRFG